MEISSFKYFTLSDNLSVYLRWSVINTCLTANAVFKIGISLALFNVRGIMVISQLLIAVLQFLVLSFFSSLYSHRILSCFSQSSWEPMNNFLENN